MPLALSLERPGHCHLELYSQSLCSQSPRHRGHLVLPEPLSDSHGLLIPRTPSWRWSLGPPSLQPQQAQAAWEPSQPTAGFCGTRWPGTRPHPYVCVVCSRACPRDQRQAGTQSGRHFLRALRRERLPAPLWESPAHPLLRFPKPLPPFLPGVSAVQLLCPCASQSPPSGQKLCLFMLQTFQITSKYSAPSPTPDTPEYLSQHLPRRRPAVSHHRPDERVAISPLETHL